MIIANSAVAIFYLLAVIRSTIIPSESRWEFPVMIGSSLFNVVCAVALYQWKMWGFWGFGVSNLVALVVGLSIGLGICTSISGMVGLILLYGVLHIGRDKGGWGQLE
jgi:hypothetical protein